MFNRHVNAILKGEIKPLSGINKVEGTRTISDLRALNSFICYRTQKAIIKLRLRVEGGRRVKVNLSSLRDNKSIFVDTFRRRADESFSSPPPHLWLEVANMPRRDNNFTSTEEQ